MTMLDFWRNFPFFIALTGMPSNCLHYCELQLHRFELHFFFRFPFKIGALCLCSC